MNLRQYYLLAILCLLPLAIAQISDALAQDDPASLPSAPSAAPPVSAPAVSTPVVVTPPVPSTPVPAVPVVRPTRTPHAPLIPPTPTPSAPITAPVPDQPQSALPSPPSKNVVVKAQKAVSPVALAPPTSTTQPVAAPDDAVTAAPFSQKEATSPAATIVNSVKPVPPVAYDVSTPATPAGPGVASQAPAAPVNGESSSGVAKDAVTGVAPAVVPLSPQELDAKKLAVAQDLVRSLNMKDLMEGALSAAMNGMLPLITQENPGQDDKVTQITADTMAKVTMAHLPELEKNKALVYTQLFTYPELEQLKRFYGSPIGQKVLQETPEMMHRNAILDQTVMLETVQEVRKNLVQDLKKNGMKIPKAMGTS